MARIRTIKPDFFRHGRLFDAEKETGLPLRVAFAGLWTAADREGRFEWSPRELKLDALPYDEVDFSRVLDALWTRGHISKYTSGGRYFGFIPSWHEHQVINNRESDSLLPEPTDESIAAALSGDRLTREARVPDASHRQQEDGSFLSARNGFVYVALARSSGAFKVGFAEADPERRVRDLTTGSPEPLEFVEAVAAEKAIESTIHKALSAHAIHGEWFSVCSESASILDAWFTRAPRVLHASKGEGKGREGKGRRVNDALSDGFNAFWAVFPNHKARQDAEKAWVKLKPNAELQAFILKAVAMQSQGEDWRKEGGRFVPHAATWLNGKRWTDEGVKTPDLLAVVDI